MTIPAMEITARIARGLFFHSNQRIAGSRTSAVVLVSTMTGIPMPSASTGQIRRGDAQEATHMSSVHSKTMIVSSVASRLKANAKELGAKNKGSNDASVGETS